MTQPQPQQPLCFVSVHDVMPETLAEVEHALAILEQLGVRPVTLLIVPGRDWSAPAIARLRALVRAGHILAAHGWHHQAERIGGLYHRLHGLLLSRRVAEHLALDADGILALLARSHAWFVEQGFDPPALYVPPAWAMGAISRARLSAAGPFDQYEFFGGFFNARTGIWRSSPLLGYEADSWARVLPLRLWNALNRARASSDSLLRIGIHPHDFNHALAADLHADLRRFRRFGNSAFSDQVRA